jgi:catechol 2,3-dioxygenase-like lactoylglutathione lyase family enzyme
MLFELLKGESRMKDKLLRVGTIYIPVTNVELSSKWYVNKLGAELSYKDEDKAILNFASQSFFLVKSQANQSLNFHDFCGEERFSLTFEVNGLNALESIHSDFIKKEIKVGEVENRGHTGKNFVFYDLDGNKFDVWSELSPIFKEKYLISQ